MKKIVSLILAVALVLSLAVAVSASSPEVNLTYTEIDENSFFVNVELKNNPGFAAFVIKLEYDKYAVTPKNIVKKDMVSSGSIISNMEDSQSDAAKKSVTSAVFYTTEGNVTGDGCLYSVRFIYKDAIPADKQLQDTVITVAEPIDITNFELETVPFKAGTSVTVKAPTTEREPEPGEYDEPVKEDKEEEDKNYSSIVGALTGKEDTSENTEEAKEEKEEKEEKVYTAEVKNVEEQNKAKYIAMYEDETFKPDAPATRYEVIEALDNLFEITSEEFAPAFGDVSEKYKLTVQKFVTAKILNGYEDKTFKGDNTITRAEFVKILAVAFDMKLDETATAEFTDIAGHWAENYVKTFASCGYTKGYAEEDGTFTFRPEGNVTRAEVVAFVNRIIKAEGEASEKIPTDLVIDGENHWAYDEIVKVVK